MTHPMIPLGEPSYAGRGLRGWMALLDDPLPYRRCAAARALGEIGPDAAVAIPELTRPLGDRESGVRVQAAVALGEIGPLAAAAAPAMIAELRRANYFNGGFIGPALAKLGQAAVPPLVELIDERPGIARSEAIQALRRIGPNARAVVGRLGDVARDPEDRDRVDAASALWSIARRPDAISLLAAAVGARDDLVAESACDQLGRIGPEAKAAVPALIRALDDNRPSIRGRSAIALGEIGPAARAAVPKILNIPGTLHSGRTAFATVVAAIGREEISALIKGVDDPTDYPRWTAAEALGRIGPEARAAVPALTRLTTSPREMDRVIAATALWRVARDDRVVSGLVDLARLVEGRELSVRSAALDILGEIGPSAGEAVQALIDRLTALDNIETPKVAQVLSRIEAPKVAQVLGRIGPNANEAIAILERVSTDPSRESDLRTEADLALWRITQGKKGVAELIKELQGGSRLTASDTLSRLAEIGPGAGAAVPTIAQLLQSEQYSENEIAAILEAIGPAAKPAIPMLITIFTY